ncbi:MAG: RrF2 family transcriptional regulator [Coraliomargaritaceae bacterium]
MKLSHKLEYACRVMAQLGRFHGREKFWHVDSLSEAEQVPANYLVQILNELRTAGLIISKRGKQGGYALSREPKEISLKSIVQAIDPELLERNFTESGYSGQRVSALWVRIGEALEGQIEALTLDDFVVRGEDAQMYYI